MLGIDRTVLGRKIADVAGTRRARLCPAAQILLDGFCLGRQFDDDELQRISLTHTRKGGAG